MNREEKARLKEVVKSAFLKVHGKRSTDDVIIDDDLNKRFIASCQTELPDVSPDVFNWCLYNLRKASGIGPVTEGRKKQRHDSYLHAAEIAARFMEDKYKLNTDRVL